MQYYYTIIELYNATNKKYNGSEVQGSQKIGHEKWLDGNMENYSNKR